MPRRPRHTPVDSVFHAITVNRGRPFGDEDWRDYTVRDLGLKSSLRPRRRPKKATVEQEGAY
jgi:hypothetical protein